MDSVGEGRYSDTSLGCADCGTSCVEDGPGALDIATWGSGTACREIFGESDGWLGVGPPARVIETPIDER